MTISALYPTIKPSLNLDFANTKQLDPRITFTRASTATYYDGKTVAKAEENLFLQSQAFDAGSSVADGWQKYSVTIAANNENAPDGTATADTLTGTATSIVGLRGARTAFSGSSTISIYAKAGTASVVQIAFDADGSQFANYDLASGTLGTYGGTGMSPSIVNVGGGWYRCIATITSTTATNVYFTIQASASASRLATAASGNSAILWGAQLEQRASVTAYTPTTTQSITNYIPALQTALAGVPRFDHDPVTGESLGFLIEEQRTNLVTYSEQFDNAAWTKTDSSVTTDIVVAPDGTLTGDKLIEAATTATHATSRGLDNTVSTFSVYAKAAGRNYVTLCATNGAGTYYAITYDLVNGAVTQQNVGGGISVTYGISSVGNGWYRCWAYTASLAGYRNISISSVPSPANTASIFGRDSYTGDGTSGIYLWGAQLEAGAFLTSYIPTVASQVTRSADAASMTGTNFSSWYRAGEGTLYSESSTKDGSLTPMAIKLDGGNDQNRIQIGRTNTAGAALRAVVVSGNVTQTPLLTVGTTSAGVFAKISFAYAVDNFIGCTNASLSAADTSGVVPPVNRMGIGIDLVNSTSLNGTLKRIAYYPKRLTNAQLQSITS